MTAKDQAATRIGMPMAEFIRAFDVEGPFELIDGERQPIMPNASEHSEIIKLLYNVLWDFERTFGLVRVYSESTFALTDSPDWVRGSRVPDLLVYLAERLRVYKDSTPDWKRKPFVLVPDLCVEIVSPNDELDQLVTKAFRYLNDGVQVVWLVLPTTKEVYIYRSGIGLTAKLSANHKLEDADLLPAFSVKVGAIFPE